MTLQPCHLVCVGTRSCSTYGTVVAENIAAQLAGQVDSESRQSHNRIIDSARSTQER